MKPPSGLFVTSLLLVLVVSSAAFSQEWTFIRGDLNGDGKLAIGDPLIHLNHLFLSGPEPLCLDTGDMDDDGLLTLIDGIDLLTYMFATGFPPRPPFPACGIDPTPDSLSCVGPLSACPPAEVQAPTGLTVTVGSYAHLDLSWQDNSGDETGFEIHRSESGPGGPFALRTVIGANLTTFSDPDLTPATDYCYLVRAFNDFGTSDDSNTACETTAVAPVPGNLVATATSDTEIHVTWQDNTADETGVELERSENGAGGPFVQLGSFGPNTTSFTDTDLMPASEYCYRARSLFVGGASDFSNVDCAATNDPPPPADPSGLVVTASSHDQVDLIWQDNSGDETGFEIERSANGIGGPYTLLAVVGANVGTLADVSVLPVVEYCYRIRAVHDFGASGYSLPDCATTPPPPPPSDPSNLTAFAFSTTEISVTWSDNSSLETGFQIERSDTGAGGPFFLIATMAANSTALNDANLVPATEHCYRVRAIHAFDVSNYSNSDCDTTLTPPPPAAPTSLVATIVLPTEIGLTWQDNSGDETGFELERSVRGSPFAPYVILPADTGAFSDVDLIPDIDYCYRIRAVHDYGASNFSNNACEHPVAPPPPSAPSNSHANEISHSIIEVKWRDNSTNETGFEVERSVLGGPFERIATAGPGQEYYWDGNLTSITQYCYRVRAVHDYGVSGYTTTECATTLDPPAPHHPDGMVALDVEASEVDMAWNDNSDDETGFELERSVSGAGGPFALLVSLPANTTSFSDTGLTEGTEYCYRIRSFNEFSESTYSATLCVTTDPPPPPPLDPTNLIVTAAPERSDLTWTDNSANESEFEIDRSDSGVLGPFTLITTVPADTPFYSDAGLTAGVEYCYRVRAVNSGGASADTNSACATALPLPPPPAAPSGLVATENGSQEADLVWTDNATNETEFHVERSEDGMTGPFVVVATLPPNTSSYSDDELFASTEYCYQVRVVNEGGFGLSNVDCATTDAFTDPTLFAAYGFDEGGGVLAQDSTGNGNDGTLENGATRNSNGQYNDAVEFDGVSGNVNLGALDPTGNAFTMTAWFKADSFTASDARIVSKATSLSNDGTYWMISTIDSNGIRLRFRLKTTNGGTTQLIAVGNTVSTGVFTHVAATYDGIQMTIYQDGIPVGSTSKSGLLVTDAGAEAWIGSNPVDGRVFDGLIDNVRIYERALNQSEVLLDRDTPVGQLTITQPPDPPTSLNAAAASGSVISLNWVDNSINESSFQIERSANGPGGPFTLANTVLADVTGYVDGSLSPLTQYCYRVRALNIAGASDYTMVACATTLSNPDPPVPPPPPTNFDLWVYSTSEMVLTWHDNSSTETGFEIQRAPNSGGPYSLIDVAEIDQQTYFDFDVIAETQYCYRIRSVNGNGVSDWTPSLCKYTTPSSRKHRVLFDTGVVEVSETGPYYPRGNHGEVEYQTHVPIGDFNWTSPVDYTRPGSKIQMRIDVFERPTLEFFCAKQPLQEQGLNGDHWWGSNAGVVDPNIYLMNHNVLSMNDVTGLIENLNNPPPLRMAFAVGCVRGNPNSVNSPWTDARIFPMQCRFTWVVTEGVKFVGWERIVGAARPIMEPLGEPFVVAYPAPLTVSMASSTEKSKIRYTLDGSEPTPSDPLYTGPLSLSVTTTVKARTFAPGIADSDTTTTTYVIE